MLTRSKTRVEIDFDESSKAWLKNKRKLLLVMSILYDT